MIDCHMLHLPGEREDWRALAIASVSRCPSVTLHHVAGIPGDYFGARRRGFAAGDAPYVSYVDPDDYVIGDPFPQCLRAVERSGVAAVWTRSMVSYGGTPELAPFDRPHQIIVARRSAVNAALPYARNDRDLWERVGQHGRIVKLPVVGYVWRCHPKGHSWGRGFSPAKTS